MAEAHRRFLAAREALVSYSRRLGLVGGDDSDSDAAAGNLDLTVDTAEELLRLDDAVKKAWGAYLAAGGEDGRASE